MVRRPEGSIVVRVEQEPVVRRSARNSAIVAAHQQWHGIRHPERLFCDPGQRGGESRRAYVEAVLRGLERLRRAEALYARIAAVSDRAHKQLGVAATPSVYQRAVSGAPSPSRPGSGKVAGMVAEVVERDGDEGHHRPAVRERHPASRKRRTRESITTQTTSPIDTTPAVLG
jgi:hypothetical protein